MILALAAAAALQPQTLFTVDPQHRLIECVASDGRNIWVSSLIDRQILECACATADYTGMGTTVVAVQEHDGVLSVAHAGDSRAYRLRRSSAIRSARECGPTGGAALLS